MRTRCFVRHKATGQIEELWSDQITLPTLYLVSNYGSGVACASVEDYELLSGEANKRLAEQYPIDFRNGFVAYLPVWENAQGEGEQNG